MMNVKFKCSDEIRTLILDETTEVKETAELNRDSILILEVNSADDLAIDIDRDYTLAVIIENGDLIFDILEYRPEAILRKDRLEKDLQLLIDLNKKKRMSHILEFKSGHLTVRQSIDTILYIESFGHYIQVHTISGRFMSRDKLKDVLKKVEEFNFKQIHKSYIVNMSFVNRMNNKVVILKDGTVLNIGRMYKLQL